MTASISVSQAVVYTWVGNISNDWADASNWDGNVLPAEDVNGVKGGSEGANTLVIQNGAFAPTTNVPAYSNKNGSNTTPRFDVQAGASLTINQATANSAYGGPTYGGDIVTVGGGGSLTWVSTTGYRLMRDPNGTQDYDINGGTFTLEAPAASGRLDFGQNNGRLVNFDLDGGTFNYTGLRMFGNRSAAGTYTTPSTVALANGSVFNSSAFFAGNMEDGSGNPTLVFDLQDPGSSATFRLGTAFVDLAAVEAAEGTNWTSSTLGDTSLAYTQTGDFVTISVVPEPSSSTLIGLVGLVFILRRRK